MRWVRLVAASLVVVGCSSSTPATTPTSIPTTSTPTTTLATTTTVDRLAEIEAIYQDLEERRLDALYRGDDVAYRALFANEAYMEASMGAFDVIEFSGPPTDVSLWVEEVLQDTAVCLAARVGFGPVDSIVGSAGTSRLLVLEVGEDGGWGFSYTGEGWVCDGPHPFSS